ncbi:MAG: ATP-binding cassette domain-containing protein, partial [Rickettsiales bacterium]|nr:ATP-binding cassette domain-containing protein [Rickettsiales bacterium]
VDVTVQAKILQLLKQLQRDMGMAMLFITHDLTLVRRLADRVAVMKAGEIVEIGPVAEVFAQPKHPYTQMLLGSEPKGAPLPPSSDTEVVTGEDVRVHFAIRAGVLRRVKGFTKAVDGVRISLPEGSCTGIVGESGSGKTTLGFALLRLVPSSGRIVFLGQEIQGLGGQALRGLRQRMQMVFQDPYSSLNPRMNVRQIIAEGLNVHCPHMREAEKDAAVAKVLVDVGLSPDMASRYPHEFSGGQRQRISIARAMVLRPRFVVLDEPTSALDLTVQAQIIELLKGFQREYQVSYLFISHDLRVVKAIAHQLIVMQHGRVVEQGSAESIFANPRQPYTQTLLNAAFLKE